MKKEEVLKIFKDTGTLLKGHFELSSGLHTSKYLQCAKVLQYPEYAGRLCSELARYFKEDKPTCVIGPALGGIIVSYETAKALGVRSIFTERKDGKMQIRRGFEIAPNDRVLVVEDVITTGFSTKEVIDIVRTRGATIIAVGSIIDRSVHMIDFGVRQKSLVKLDIPVFEPKDCPLCRDKIKILKPGSR
jgi:orotate phosphoribosyltransferase